MRFGIKHLIFCLIAPAIFASSSFAAIYVDQNAPGPAHDGTTWDTAFAAIQEGIEAATPGGEVWVADGVYVENVVMGEGVQLYGGFLGAEPGGYEDSLDQRDYVNNATTIDGNQSGSCVTMALEARVDGFTITNGDGTLGQYDRRYGGGFHCAELGESGVIANNTIIANTADFGGGIYCQRSSPAITDNTISDSLALDSGGGMYCDESSPCVTGNTISNNTVDYAYGGGVCCWENSSPAIAGNTIGSNSAEQGGGIYCDGYSTPTIAHNIFSGNSAGDGGGAMSFHGTYGANPSPVVVGNTITDNSAEWGGGIQCHESSPTVMGNTVSGNAAQVRGGGMEIKMNSHSLVVSNMIIDNWAPKGGGLRCISEATLTSNVISGNSAQQGGGLYCDAEAGETSTTITNNTIWANSANVGAGIYCRATSLATVANNAVVENVAQDQGGGIYCEAGASPSLSRNDFWGNAPDDYSGCDPGEGDISADPMFVDPDAGDFHLQAGSPCIDTGDNDALGLPRIDFEGDLRILDGNGDDVPVVDIGADEVAPQDHVVTIIDLPTEDVTIVEDTAVEFAGTAYHTGDLPIVDHLWTFGEGSGVPDMHVEDPGEVVFPEPGIFTVSFDAQAEDGSWCPLPDTRIVTVEAIAPDAVIDLPGSDLSVDPGQYVEFAGTASDANGYIADWLWTFGEGSGIEDMHVEDPGPVQFNYPGVFPVTFNAQDNEGNWDPEPDTRTIYVWGQLRVYVDQDSPGPDHDGTSWDTAFLTIGEGVAVPGSEAWVADGTYVENIVMRPGVAIYGGFLGAEEGGYETELSQRDFVNNVTTVDGNQSGSCVVMAVESRVDGFTVTNGSGTVYNAFLCGGGFFCLELGESGVIANNIITANSADSGAGICTRSGSSPDVRGNLISENYAHWHGGGISCRDDSSPTITDNVITGHTGASYGGGIFVWEEASPTLEGNLIANNGPSEGGGLYLGSFCQVVGNTISDNLASEGGGIRIVDCSPVVSGNVILNNGASRGGGICCVGGASPTISHNVFSGNGWGVFGGAIYCRESSPTIASNIMVGNWVRDYGGGVFCGDESAPALTNNTIWGNSAKRGGGINCSSDSNPSVTNNIVGENVATYQGGGIRSDESSTPLLSHNDFWENSPEDYYGCEPGEGDISADPMFVDPDTGDFHLTLDSPCIDAGTNSAPGLPETDWEGEDRIVNGTVDIGADEYLTHYTEAPDPQPECDGPLFGGSQSGFPGWVWFSIPLTPDCVVGSGCGDPNALLGFESGGWLWRYDKYIKAPEAYRPPFAEWELAVGDSYLFYVQSAVPNPSFEGVSPFTPFSFDHKLGRQGWTWIGMPGLAEFAGDDFMSTVRVKYPSDETAEYRTAAQDYESIPDNWLTWGWPYWNTWRQGSETFTPYAPFGHNTCYPWVGYRVWVKAGTAADPDDPDQVTLMWPRP